MLKNFAGSARMPMLGAFLAVVLVTPSLQAGLIFNWSFGPGTSPVKGTISFDSVSSGVGGTGLTPDSITITSAPGHVFTSGYEIGDNVIGPPLGAFIDLPSNPSWSIDTNDQVIAGGAAFIAFPSGTADQLILDSSNAGNSFLNTSSGITSASNLVFTAVPEPGSFGLLSLFAVGLLRRRRRATALALETDSQNP